MWLEGELTEAAAAVEGAAAVAIALVDAENVEAGCLRGDWGGVEAEACARSSTLAFKLGGICETADDGEVVVTEASMIDLSFALRQLAAQARGGQAMV